MSLQKWKFVHCIIRFAQFSFAGDFMLSGHPSHEPLNSGTILASFQSRSTFSVSHTFCISVNKTFCHRLTTMFPYLSWDFISIRAFLSCIEPIADMSSFVLGGSSDSWTAGHCSILSVALSSKSLGIFKSWWKWWENLSKILSFYCGNVVPSTSCSWTRIHVSRIMDLRI